MADENAIGVPFSTLAQTLVGDTTQADMVDTILSGATLTTATVAGTDKILGQDADDSDNIKTYTAQDIADLSPAGTVTSVSGTANRISSTGGATPVIDIDAAYVGQASITTLGTITTGVWTGTDIAVADGGTGASTAGDARTNLGLVIGTDVQAYDAGLNSIAGLATAANTLIYTTALDAYAVVAAANSSMLVTSGAGVPSLSTAIPDGMTATKQTIGDDSTKVATTSYVNEVVKTGQTDVACNSVATFTQNIDTNHYFKLTFTSNCTLDFTFTAGQVQSMCVELIDAGAYTVTLPAGLKWAGGTAPTFTSSGRDIIVVWNNGDDLISAALIGQDFS